MHRHSPLLSRISIAAILVTPPLLGQTSPVPLQLAALEPASLPDSPGTVAARAAVPLDASSSADTTVLDPQIISHGRIPQPNLIPGQRPPDPATASPHAIIVLPGQIAPPQTAGDKVVSSLYETISPFSFAGSLVSAGYSHLVDSAPNYGVDSGAFGQRLGAAVVRGASQNLFTVGAMAPILREDPRYYQLGPKVPLVHRAVYAATRSLVGRTDSGRTTPNFALLSGYLGAAFLTRTYYPDRNTSTGDVLQTWGSSIGGASLGFLVTEFLPDALQIVHLNNIIHR